MHKVRLPKAKASSNSVTFYFGYSLSFRDINSDNDFVLISKSKHSLLQFAESNIPTLKPDPSGIQKVAFTKSDKVTLTMVVDSD